MASKIAAVLVALVTLLGLGTLLPSAASAALPLVGMQNACVNSVSSGPNGGSILVQWHENQSVYTRIPRGDCQGEGEGGYPNPWMSPNGFFTPAGECIEWWTDANPDVKHVPQHHVVDARGMLPYTGKWTFTYPGDSWPYRWSLYMQKWDC
jgi:hypothetical protein